MAKNTSGFTASGLTHPEISNGDKWKDKRGNIVVIVRHQFNRVTFIRDGYSGECLLPTTRFEREFILMERQALIECCNAKTSIEKIQNLRALINAGKEIKEGDDNA